MSSPHSPRQPWVVPAILAAAFLVLTGIFLAVHPSGRGYGAASGASAVSSTTVGGLPAAPAPKVMELGDTDPPTVSGWVDVFHPKPVREALRQNAWLAKQLDAPLGRGFIGGWAGLFGTKGEDLHASFRGELAGFALDELLDHPFRVSWYAVGGNPGSPAILIPHPSGGTRASYSALDQVAKRGTQSADACPGADAKQAKAPLTLSRWMIAEENLYVALTADRMVIARQPSSAVFALCEPLPQILPRDGTDVEVGFATNTGARELQGLTAALGLGDSVRFGLVAQGNALVPSGIFAQVTKAGRLDGAPLSDGFIKVIPEDTAVLFTLNAELPVTLDVDNLKAFWGGQPAGTHKPRQVAMLWTPHGTSKPPDVAIVWSEKADQAQLARVFTGRNKLLMKDVCDQLVLASNAELMSHLEDACAGKTPSLQAATPAVLAGLRAASSLTLGVHLGHALARLTREGFERGDKEKEKDNAPPKEVEDAARALDELPYLGFKATAQQQALVPGGFKS